MKHFTPIALAIAAVIAATTGGCESPPRTESTSVLLKDGSVEVDTDGRRRVVVHDDRRGTSSDEDVVHERRDELQREVDRLRSEIPPLENRVEQAEHHHRKLTHQLRSLKEVVAAENETLDALRVEIAAAEELLLKRRRNVANADQLLADRHAELHDLDDKVAELREQRHDLLRERNQLRNENDSLRDRRQRLTAEVSEMQAVVGRLIDTAEHLDEKIADALAEHDRLRAAIRPVRDERDNVAPHDDAAKPMSGAADADTDADHEEPAITGPLAAGRNGDVEAVQNSMTPLTVGATVMAIVVVIVAVTVLVMRRQRHQPAQQLSVALRRQNGSVEQREFVIESGEALSLEQLVIGQTGEVEPEAVVDGRRIRVARRGLMFDPNGNEAQVNGKPVDRPVRIGAGDEIRFDDFNIVIESAGPAEDPLSWSESDPAYEPQPIGGVQ